MSEVADKITSLIRKDLQDTLDALMASSLPVNKYWEYVGKLIQARQVLSKLGYKLHVNVVVMGEGV